MLCAKGRKGFISPGKRGHPTVSEALQLSGDIKAIV